MNLVEAAIEVLKQRGVGAALSADELATAANELGLVDKPSTPSSMKGRLATEMKKGEGSRVERTEQD
ncbi:MAG TPA: HTH domain-containing protein, partial [Kofleriaceae bacterium]|nr:HTH domain-containing protein [Kofleriaceae bacterium]